MFSLAMPCMGCSLSRSGIKDKTISDAVILYRFSCLETWGYMLPLSEAVVTHLHLRRVTTSPENNERNRVLFQERVTGPD
jgi:hypothetical protein